MARLEGAYEQINERLSELRGNVQSLDLAIGRFGETLRAEVAAGDTALRSEMMELRRRISAQFYWTLTLILTSILVPLLRELAR